MLTVLAILVLLAAILSSAEIERREARLLAGTPVWADLARITGVADQRELARLPGVSLAGDGRLRFDPTRRTALPTHLTGSLVEHRWGHGLCLALAIAVLGLAFEPNELPLVATMLLALAGCYQLLARLYALTVWVEARSHG